MGTAVAAAALAMALAGCGGAPTGDELFEQAREANATFKDAVAQVQLQVFDGEWDVGDYGDLPMTCDSGGYRFSVDRYTPTGWRFPDDPDTLRRAIADRLEADGWQDVTGISYDADIDTLTLTAHNDDLGVELLIVQFHPGLTQDGVTVRADSTCQPGDQEELELLVFPDYPDTSWRLGAIPNSEHPLTPPIFGYEGAPAR